MNQVISGLLLFATLGILLARELLFQLGIAPDYLYIGVGAMAIAALLMFRGALLIMLVGIMTLAVNLPEDMLLTYGLDKDVLLGFLLALILFPLVHRFMSA